MIAKNYFSMTNVSVQRGHCLLKQSPVVSAALIS